ncbi:hypothetical protein [Cohnella hongkongensis]|uniref:Uncharacterized protein n=1 Tax=Cohnella hongkongensis TaxID=178337 RepID=A0ABV9FAR2_9BACL
MPNVSVHSFLDELMNELFVFGGPVVLILDDYHSIADGQIHASLTYFIEYLPDNVHVAIASRTDLPFPTSKWLAREGRTPITSDQLQFTMDEMIVFCANTAERPLSHRHMAKLLERTEGWVTGLLHSLAETPGIFLTYPALIQMLPTLLRITPPSHRLPVSF